MEALYLVAAVEEIYLDGKLPKVSRHRSIHIAHYMITQKIAELGAARAKLEKLEQSIAEELNRELAGLPGKYGFDSVEAFTAAVSAAAGGRRGRKPGKAKASSGGVKPRKRAKITDETRSQVKKLVAAGRTGAEIARAVGVSLPSVQNIKKALGLVQKRK